MTHHDHEDHEILTVTEFFEEYWPLLFFGLFFLMTCFMPILFAGPMSWMTWGLVGVFAVVALLMGYAVLAGKAKGS